jgi:uncharacterized protein YukE
MKKKPKQTPKKLTRREGVLLEHIRAGKTITDAARQAGFSKKWPGQAGSQAFQNIQKKMPKILDELGLTYKAIIKELEDSKNI